MKHSEQTIQQYPHRTVAVIGSATYAEKAARVLSAAAIGAKVVKTGSTRTAGSAYGVSFPTAQKPNAAYVLHGAGIAVREYLESEI